MFLSLFRIGRTNLGSKGDHSSADIGQIKEMERHSWRKYFEQNQRSMKCAVGLQINKYFSRMNCSINRDDDG